MKINIIEAVKIYTTKKDFLVYTMENNKLEKSLLTNDLTRHRKKFGINSKFILTDIIKKEIKFININL